MCDDLGVRAQGGWRGVEKLPIATLMNKFNKLPHALTPQVWKIEMT